MGAAVVRPLFHSNQLYKEVINLGKKRNKKNNLNPWLTANRPEQKDSFIQVGVSLATHPAFKDLSYSAKFTYEQMCRAANYAKNNGLSEFVFPQSVFSKYGITRSTFQKAKEQLISHGFIVCTFCGKNQRVESKYKMVNWWKEWNPLNGCLKWGRLLSKNGTANNVGAPDVECQPLPKMDITISGNDETPHET